jgi:hypothetical protein
MQITNDNNIEKMNACLPTPTIDSFLMNRLKKNDQDCACVAGVWNAEYGHAREWCVVDAANYNLFNLCCDLFFVITL